MAKKIENWVIRKVVWQGSWRVTLPPQWARRLGKYVILHLRSDGVVEIIPINIPIKIGGETDENTRNA